MWSSSIAIGSEKFIKDVQEKLSARAKGRTVITEGSQNALKEPQASYNVLFGGEKAPLRAENSHFLDINHEISMC
jgi:hypothetical protein